MSQFEKKLLGNLCEYERAGIFDSDVRKRFENYLNTKIEASKSFMSISSLYILYALGIVILSLGVILLISYNWNDLPKAVRLFLGFSPLIFAGILGLWYFYTKDRRSLYWREIIPVLNTLGVIVSLAVCSQVYHISGNLTDFMRVVVVLCVLLPFLFNSGISAAINIVMICFLLDASKSMLYVDHTIIVLSLAAIGIFLFYPLVAGERNPIKAFAAAIYMLAAPFALTVLCISSHTDYSNLGIIIYPTLCGLALALFAVNPKRENWAYVLPTLVIAKWSAFITLLVFATNSYIYRTSESFSEIINEASGLQVFVMSTIAFAVLTHICLLIRAWVSKSSDKAVAMLSLASLAGLLIFISDNFLSDIEYYLPIYYLVNILCIISGTAFIIKGVKTFSLYALNIGVLMITAFVFTKFIFDDSFSLLFRGVVFIIMGISVILLNYYMISIRRERIA